MTTLSEAPAHLDSRAARFAPLWRATASRRIVGAVIADGIRDGRRHRLVMPAERVATAAVAYRAFSAEFSIDTVSTQYGLVPAAVAGSVRAALGAAADQFDIRGRCAVRVALPYLRDSGADVAAATAWAAVDALLEAANVSHTHTSLRELSAHSGLAALAPGPAGFGVHDVTTGDFTDRAELVPRFGLIIVHTPGSSTDPVTNVGRLPDEPVPSDTQDFADWLVKLNGPVDNPVAQAAREAGTIHGALGTIGGHTPSDPVCVLLPPGPDHLSAAQRARAGVAAALADRKDLVVTYALQGRTI